MNANTDAPKIDNLAIQLKALGHPVRLEIIRHLANCEHCCCADVCDCLPLAQSTVSQHLNILKEANLIESWQDGNRSKFSLNKSALALLQTQLNVLVPQT